MSRAVRLSKTRSISHGSLTGPPTPKPSPAVCLPGNGLYACCNFTIFSLSFCYAGHPTTKPLLELSRCRYSIPCDYYNIHQEFSQTTWLSEDALS